MTSLQHLHRFAGGFDAAAFRAINGAPHPAVLNAIMLLATLYATGEAQVGISLGFITLGLLADRTDARRAGCAGLIALSLSAIAVDLAKRIGDRPRPLLQLHHVNIVSEKLFTQSFPSGHASTAFAVAFAYSAFLPKLRVPLLVLAFLAALSRVYIGVHFPLDTVYGALMGTAIAIASAWIVGMRRGESEKTELTGEVPTAG